MIKSFLVIGMGRFGTSVAKELCELGHEVLAVDNHEVNIENVQDTVTHAVIADATEERTLKSLGIRNYDAVIVSIGQDLASSVLITLAVKELGAAQIVCKARDEQHRKILEQIGADRVIIPEEESGAKLALQVSEENIIDSLEVSETFGILEINLPTRWAGKRIRQIDIRRKYACFVAAVKKAGAGDTVIVSPGPDYVFEVGDILVLLGDKNDLAEVSHL
ncbi:MAG: TrkA family potassium uptake protein [Oscillospiraceae bacterium]|nr:TrkA family potassium uptake protein [Oscillospiraceae bacterium]